MYRHAPMLYLRTHQGFITRESLGMSMHERYGGDQRDFGTTRFQKRYEISGSDVALYQTVQRDVSQELAELGWNKDNIESAKIAVEELVRNAVIHGVLKEKADDHESPTAFKDRIASMLREGQGKGSHIDIGVSATSTTLTLRLTDEGPMFEIPSLQVPRTIENLLRTSGNGLLLLQGFGEVRVEQDSQGRGKTVVFTMTRTR